MKRLLLASLAFLFIYNTFSQNNPPVAVDDTVNIISQTPLEIDILQNDFDPDGDNLLIYDWDDFYDADIDTVNGKIRIKFNENQGKVVFQYSIKDDGVPSLTSLNAHIFFYIQQNPEAPVANSDTFDLPELIPADVDLLLNDTDPDGDELKIIRLSYAKHCDVILHEDSLMITVIPRMSTDTVASFSYMTGERNTPETLVSDWTSVHINLINNPDIPVVLPDSASTTGGYEIIIPVMENDYDPQGEELEFKKLSEYVHGEVSQSGTSILYKPEVSFQGKAYITYSLKEVEDSNIYSKSTKAKIEVSKNPDCPIGVPDLANGMTYEAILIDVLANDYDFNDDPLEVWDIKSSGEVSISENIISYRSSSLKMMHDTLYYRNRQLNNILYYSEWTPVLIDLEANPALPVAVHDYAGTIAGNRIIISPLSNDLNNSSDSLILRNVNLSHINGYARVISDSLVAYQSFTNGGGIDTIKYLFYDKSDSLINAIGTMFIDVLNNSYYDSLVINNINAGVNADGYLFCDMGQVPDEGRYGESGPHFKYPAGSETNTIYTSSFWIGGYSNEDSLHFAGEVYKYDGIDFTPGPVSDIYDQAYSDKFRKLWKINKSDIEYHRNNWWKEGYQPIGVIQSWPGNGDVSSGQSAQLAPFSDNNGDGIYDPMDGDYPLIRGDQTIFFICNDDTIHSESEGKRLKVEIHGMVYGFDAPDDSVLNNTVFVHYDIINRSENTYYDIYTGVFTELDIGNCFDDYIGSDVTRASYYAYNGEDFDYGPVTGIYEGNGYGEFPPAQSVTVLAGPFMDSDGTDNPSGGCDFSVNGNNFGNGISDDERLGLTGFITFYEAGFEYLSSNTDKEYYKLMNGYLTDGTRCWYGGFGHFSNNSAVGPLCNFLYPGDSDPLNWGTGCVPPNELYNQDGYYWTDSTENMPFDRRGLGTMGPFTFKPGDVQEIELAYCVANGWDGPVSSIVQLMENIDSLRQWVSNGEIIVANDYLGLKGNESSEGRIRIFPNPAIDRISIMLEGIENSGSEFVIYDVFGRMATSGKLMSGTQNTIDISYFKPGFYFISVKSVKMIYSGKFIKR